MAPSEMKIVVIGATPNPERFAYKAVRKLVKYDYQVVALGIREGSIEGIKIYTDKPEIEDVHTILLYVNPKNQSAYYDYIVNLKPRRIIFNPGTENHVLAGLAEKHGIETVHDCALIMLSTNTF